MLFEGDNTPDAGSGEDGLLTATESPDDAEAGVVATGVVRDGTTAVGKLEVELDSSIFA